jgi:hypothetical protein
MIAGENLAVEHRVAVVLRSIGFGDCVVEHG